MSDSIRLGTMLAFSGGFMDAYSYIERNHVFANAQTGNILLFGVNLSEGNYQNAIKYFFPFFAFALGIALAEIVHNKNYHHFHWRQMSVLFEAVILLGVAFIPLSMNMVANALTSFACGIQVESFRKIHGNGIATTMCIGNMRSGTQNLCLYFQKKDKSFLSKSMLYYGIIACFAIGAIVGNKVIYILNEKAILVCSIALFIAFLMMFIDMEKQKNK